MCTNMCYALGQLDCGALPRSNDLCAVQIGKGLRTGNFLNIKRIEIDGKDPTQCAHVLIPKSTLVRLGGPGEQFRKVVIHAGNAKIRLPAEWLPQIFNLMTIVILELDHGQDEVFGFVE